MEDGADIGVGLRGEQWGRSGSVGDGALTEERQPAEEVLGDAPSYCGGRMFPRDKQGQGFLCGGVAGLVAGGFSLAYPLNLFSPLPPRMSPTRAFRVVGCNSSLFVSVGAKEKGASNQASLA